MVIRIIITLKQNQSEVRDLVNWTVHKIKEHYVLPGSLIIKVKNCSRTFAGRSFKCFNGRPLVVCRIGASNKFPIEYQYPGLKTSPRYELSTWQEALVSLCAHELMHQNQFLFNKKRSELECEDVSLKILTEYRESNNNNTTRE